MDLEFLLSNPKSALNYAENFINFINYFENRLSDDIDNYARIKCENAEGYIINDKIYHINPLQENIPDFFILNLFEKEKNYGSLDLEKISMKKTSSPRTYLIPQLKIYVKTHFSGRISSRLRIIDEDLIKKTIDSSEMIRKRIHENIGVSYFKEFAGTIWNGVGCIYRSGEPFPKFEGAIIPIHSLFGIDYNKPNDLPLFVQIAKEKGISPEDFVIYDVIKPILKSWKWFTFDLKKRITCHGQNVLY